MKNLNLKEFFGSTVLAFNHDGRTTVERRSNDGHIRRHLPVGLTKLLSLLFLLTLGTGQMWGATSTTLYFCPEMHWDGWTSSDGIKVQVNHKGDDFDWHDYSMSLVSGKTYHGYPIYKATFTDSYDGLGAIQFHDNSWSKKTQPFGEKDWHSASTYNNKLWTGSWSTMTYDTQTSVTIYYVCTNSEGYTIKANMQVSKTYSRWQTVTMTNTGKTYQGTPIYSATFTDYQNGVKTLQLQRYSGSTWKDQVVPINNSWTAKSTYSGKMYKGSSWIAYNYDHKVTFNANGGTGTMTDQKMNYNTSTALKTNTFERAGYDFDGWAISADGDVAYSDGASVTLTDSDLPLYAHWTASASPAVTLTASKTTGINVGETITLTATGANASNITKYEFYEGETKVGESATNTYSYTPTTVDNKTVKVVMTYNSGSNTVTSSNVALTLNTPSVALKIKTGSANNFYLGEGSTILKATPSNVGAGVTPSYVFTDQIAGGVTSSSQTETEWTYNPSVSGQAKARTMKVTMSVGGSTYTATVNVSVYEHFTVHIKNTDSWSGMYVYMWNASGNNGAFPGVQQELWNGSDLIYNVVLDTKYTNFIISQGNNSKQSNTISMLAASSAGNCYTTTTGTSLPAMTCPAVPSVTTTAASAILNTSATLGCNITNLNRDNASEYGYYYSTNSTLSSANATTVGTRVKIGDRKTTTGNKSKSQTGLSANTTYYVIAYAKNCAGTGWGSIVNFTTLSQTTVSFNTHGGSAVSNVTAVKTKAMPAISAPTRTGYTFNGMYDAASEGTQYYTSTGASARTWDKNDASFTLHAQWTPITYTVKFNANGGTGSMSNQTGIAYDSETTLTANAFTRTGYTFQGWATSAGGEVVRADRAVHGNLSSTQNAIVDLYAVWQPKTYTVSFSQSGTGYASGGQTANKTATYDADMPGSISLPTAANGYAFMGYYDNLDPLGTQYYTSTGASAHVWDKDEGATLYAYFKKAEITALALSAGTVLPGGSVTATATVAPNPTGDTHIDWKLLYNNGTEYSPQPSEFSSTAQSVEFPAPTASGTYKVQAQLRTGSVGGSGTLLSERTTSFVVAGTHTVTIQYKCGDQVIKTATTREGVMPLTWSESITAPNDIFGYTFDHWEAGDGVTISTNGTNAIVGTTTTEDDIYIKAIYDGRLTAVYTKKNIIYFKNTLGWSDVYAHFLGSSYWDTSNGTGNNGRTDRNKQMTRLGETDIWYFDYGAVGITPNDYLVFTDRSYNNWSAFNEPDISTKPAAPVVYPIIRDNTEKNGQGYGFNAGTPMFVPVTQDGIKKCDNKAIYFNNGYWRAYDPTTGESGSTGYTLKIYDKTSSDGRNLLQSIPFANADASGQIFKASINLEAAKEYGIKVERDNSLMYTNIDGHLHRTGEVVAMSVNPDDYRAIYILTTAAGDYDFIITCNGSGQLCLQATFPAAKNDYRVLYTDNATWSNGAHTPESWVHPSRVISAKAGATDTISFFVSKDNSPEYKIQKVSSINEGTGAITWTDVTSWESISVDKTGVYNFIFTQPSAGSISRSKTEAYTGNYYIRTDNAGSTKWENYREEDHKMTYSEYAAKITHTGEEWKDFTHYFMKYVDKDTEDGKYKNVNFTVANDYSPCISDTLVQQAGDVSDSPSYTHVDGNGDLQENANIRFMWNSKNNKLQRAYLAAAQTDGSKFLVLQGQSGKLLAPDGTPLSDANDNNHDGGTDAIQFTDKEHWMYEAEVKAVPGGRVKLYATYNSNTFYYYGDNTASFIGASAIDLVTGDGGEAQTIRVVYDFKTDRLIAAWVPSEETIENEKTVNADIMLIREHQGQGHQINLKGSGSIKTNKTVYGVLRFNRWTLNNKSTAAGHAVLPVGEQKSQYERFNYFISFPFDVKVGEIFGFGTIGRHYRIFYYDGLGRAQEGFFAERGDDNWRMIDDTDSILHANQGYLLQLNSIRMKDDNTETWPQANLNEVELYFPAMNEINTIKLEDVEIPALGDAYKCKINLKPTYEAQGNPKADEADRRVKDSYWRCIGVPGFTSYEFNADTSVNFNWKAETEELPYLYEWHMDDNKLSVVSSSTFTFLPMHAYLIQNGNSFTWTSVAVPSASSVVARRQAPASEDSYYEFYLEMSKDEEALDHTYVRLTNNESVTTDFDFGQDLSKELNSGANIYTQVGYERLAANNLPLNNQTTIVPVGVTAAEEGEYTFAMPEGTNGTGVTLIDNETGTRTSLALTDYTVTLAKGTYDNRFVLEFSPVAQTPTGIEDAETVNRKSSNRKLLIDGILYIVKDGQVFDARGTKVK